MKGHVNSDTGTWHRLPGCAGEWSIEMDAETAKDRGYTCCGNCSPGGWSVYAPTFETDGGPLGPTEDDTDRDGPFSYTGEFHAFQHGLAVGFAAVMPSNRLRSFVYASIGLEADSRTAAMREVRKESQYATGGVIVGVLLGIGVLAAIAWLGLEHAFAAFAPENDIPAALRVEPAGPSGFT